MRRVLIAVDDSTESLEAARVAAKLAAGWKAALRLLTVVPSTADAAQRGAAERLLDHVAREAAAAGVARDATERIVRGGEVFRCILEEAHAWSADLIVMAVSDRKRLRSPYVGSETEHVLEFSDCPVLVVPGALRKREQPR